MIDPLCIICTPGLCVHGEQSVTPDELLIDSLKRQIADLTAQCGGAIAEVANLRGVNQRLIAERDQAEADRKTAAADGYHAGLYDYFAHPDHRPDPVASEREACAAIAKKYAAELAELGVPNGVALALEAAIRARGGT